jgi:hypothetical protein
MANENPMTDKEAAAVTQQGFEILCMWSRNIAMLPLEDWLEALNRAETIAPIIDPTLYIHYQQSAKAHIIKKLIELAIPLKQHVIASQDKIHQYLPSIQ